MTSFVQRRSRLRVALGLLYLGLVLVVCGDAPDATCKFRCDMCVADPNNPLDPNGNDPNDTVCNDCEACKFALDLDEGGTHNHVGSLDCDGNHTVVFVDPAANIQASVDRFGVSPGEVIGPAGCNQVAIASDGSVAGSIKVLGNQVRNEGMEVVCTFQLPVGDSAARHCTTNVDASFFYSGASPSTTSVLINASFVITQLGLGEVSFDARATVECGGRGLVLAPGDFSYVLGPQASGGCILRILFEATTSAEGVNAIHAGVHLRAVPDDCLANAECQLADPLTPCCGFNSCHDCSVGNPCSHDTQCADGLFCSRFECSEGNLSDRCDTDFECLEFLVCDDFLCAPAASCNPVDNEGCAPGQRCCSIGRIAFGEDLNAECCPEGDVPPGDPCIVDSSGQDDCTGGHLCAAGICQEICQEVPDSCPQDQQCDVGLYSIENVRGDGLGICSTVP